MAIISETEHILGDATPASFAKPASRSISRNSPQPAPTSRIDVSRGRESKSNIRHEITRRIPASAPMGTQAMRLPNSRTAVRAAVTVSSPILLTYALEAGLSLAIKASLPPCKVGKRAPGVVGTF